MIMIGGFLGLPRFVEPVAERMSSKENGSMESAMSPGYEVGVLTFEGHDAAERLVTSLRGSGVITKGNEVAILEHAPGGRFSVHSYESEASVGSHVAGGAIVGGLLTSLLFGPFGLVAGLIGGGLVGASLGGSHPHELGMSQEFTAKLRASLPRDSSAVLIIGDPQAVSELMSHIHASDVVTKVEIHEPLTEAQVQTIKQALEAQKA
jgi:uncharacterized membrane protein